VSNDAAALLEDAYFFLLSRGLVDDEDVLALQAWLLALRSAGYNFPGAVYCIASTQKLPPSTPGVSTNTQRRLSPLLSPSRPTRFDALDIHAAVHINWARDTASAAVPTWHVVHAAQFRSVSYHLDVSGQGADAVAPATFFPALAAQVSPLPAWPPAPAGAPSGYLAYESFLPLWSAAGPKSGEGRGNISPIPSTSSAPAAAAILWTHDDLVTDPRSISAWLGKGSARNRTGDDECVVVMDSPGDSEVLPPVSAWPSGTWWLPRLAGEGANLVSGGISCAARGGTPLADGQLWKGYSDAFAARRACAGADAFVDTLTAMRRAGAFLEIAVHSAANCAQPNAALGKWREFSLWTDRRGDALAYRDASRGDAPPPVLHPLKLSDPVAVAVTVELRDAAWVAA
jgi:hypothetical protein